MVLINPILAPDIILESTDINASKDVFDLINNNRVHLAPWFPWVKYTQELMDSIVFLQGCKQKAEKGEVITFFIKYRQKIIGLIDIHALKLEDEIPQLGYWLDKDYEGKGFMGQAVQLILDYYFKTFIERDYIAIHCAVDNIRSKQVAVKAGFQYERSTMTVLDGNLEKLDVYILPYKNYQRVL